MSVSSKVAVIDDDKAIRRALARLIRSAGFEAFTFSSAPEFLAAPDAEGVGCAVIDLRMPGLSGLELQEEINRRLPHLSVVFLTGHGDVPSSVRAMKAGAVDFLEKPVAEEALLTAVRRAIERSHEMKTSGAELEELQRRYRLLTPREREVFALVTAGFLNKQIGFDLGPSEKTIKVHRAHAMGKMEAKSLADLVRMAGRLGIRPVGKEPPRTESGVRTTNRRQ